MLFETKSKADNFIKFNKDNILEENGYAPVRSYYCEFCCGYHVTSNSSVETGERLDKIEHNILMQFSSPKLNDLEFNDYYTRVLNEVAQVESLMYAGGIKKIELLHQEIEDLRIKHKVLLRLQPHKREKFLMLSQKIGSLYGVAQKIKDILEKDDETLNDYLNNEHPSEEQKFLIPVIKGLQMMNYLANEIEDTGPNQ